MIEKRKRLKKRKRVGSGCDMHVHGCCRSGGVPDVRKTARLLSWENSITQGSRWLFRERPGVSESASRARSGDERETLWFVVTNNLCSNLCNKRRRKAREKKRRTGKKGKKPASKRELFQQNFQTGNSYKRRKNA